MPTSVSRRVDDRVNLLVGWFVPHQNDPAEAVTSTGSLIEKEPRPMANTSAAKISYRKTKSGEWVCFGPVAAFKGEIHTPDGLDTYTLDAVTVTKADGTTKVEGIERIGKAFNVNGVPHCYGYIERAKPARRYISKSDSYCEGDCLSFGISTCQNCGG
jgi:hypothetical protein